MSVTEVVVSDNQKACSRATKRLRTRILRTHSEIEEIRPIWSNWQTHPNADIDYYLTILRTRPGTEPYVLLLYDGNTPEAMLVGRIERTPLEFKIGYRKLLSIQVKQLSLISGGRLGKLDSANSQAVVHALIDSLHLESIDVAFFNHLQSGSPLDQAAKQLPAGLLQDRFQALMPHRTMALPSTMEGVYARLSAKVRKNLRWQAKKLVSDFPNNVEFRVYSQLNDLETMFKDVEYVAKDTYQRRLGVGFIDNAEMRERIRLEAEKGWLRCSILYIRDKPAAFWIGDLYGDTFHSNFMGYDGKYAKYSIGMYLIIAMIESLINEGGARPTAIDFGLGDAQYKEVLGTSQWEDITRRIFSATARGFFLAMLWSLTTATNEAARNVLSKTGMAQKLKTLWRHRLRQDSAEKVQER